MYLNQKNWSCPKKQIARTETIIAQYRKHFTHNIPNDKQYWTMCGQCTLDGNPLEGCEYLQMIKEGLIIQKQFHGVEIDPSIHRLNQQVFPQSNWYGNDFYDTIMEAYADGRFNPAIVNADLPRTPEGGDYYIAKLLNLLAHISNDTMFIGNLIIRKKHYTTKDGDYIIDKLNKITNFQQAMKYWKLVDQYYCYPGAGNTGSRIGMATVIFVKK